MNSETYRKLVNYRCANPDCDFGYDTESHHIIPKERGGKDTKDNYVCLCRKCHDMKGLHSDYESWCVTLLTWKFWQESEIKPNKIKYLKPLKVVDLNEPFKNKDNNINNLENIAETRGGFSVKKAKKATKAIVKRKKTYLIEISLTELYDPFDFLKVK